MVNNPWIEHVRNFAKANNVSYLCAITMPECKASYRNKSDTGNKIKYIYQLGNRVLFKILNETYDTYIVHKYHVTTFKRDGDAYILKFKDEPEVIYGSQYEIKKSMFSNPKLRSYSVICLKSFDFNKSMKVYHNKDGEIKMKYV